MGFRICYLAAKVEPEAMARALGLEITGTEVEMPANEWWVARLAKSGWSLLWAEDEDFGARSGELVAALSRQTAVLHCEVNETVMWSSAACWLDGETVWRITHDGGDEGAFDLKTEGDLPQSFQAIRDKHFADQGGEDSDDDFSCDHIFEVPLEVVNAEIEFRHDNLLDPKDVAGFHILMPPTRPSRPGLWSRLMGRR